MTEVLFANDHLLVELSGLLSKCPALLTLVLTDGCWLPSLPRKGWPVFPLSRYPYLGLFPESMLSSPRPKAAHVEGSLTISLPDFSKDCVEVMLS